MFPKVSDARVALNKVKDSPHSEALKRWQQEFYESTPKWTEHEQQSEGVNRLLEDYHTLEVMLNPAPEATRVGENGQEVRNQNTCLEDMLVKAHEVFMPSERITHKEYLQEGQYGGQIDLTRALGQLRSLGQDYHLYPEHKITQASAQEYIQGLDPSKIYNIRTGYNDGAGHFRLVFFDKAHDAWCMHSSNTSFYYFKIKDGKIETMPNERNTKADVELGLSGGQTWGVASGQYALTIQPLTPKMITSLESYVAEERGFNADNPYWTLGHVDAEGADLSLVDSELEGWEVLFLADSLLKFDIHHQDADHIMVNDEILVDSKQQMVPIADFYEAHASHPVVQKFKSLFELLKKQERVLIHAEVADLYALSSVEVMEKQKKGEDEAFVKLPTLMYLLQKAVIDDNQALLNVLDNLGSGFNQLEHETEVESAQRLDDEIEKGLHRQHIVGRKKVDAILNEIIEATEKTARQEQVSGKYLGSIEQHGDFYAARVLKTEFSKHLDAVEKGEETLDVAQKMLSKHIEIARLNLCSHHRIAYLLANLAVAVLSLGIVPVATRALTGQWAFFRPANAWRLDAVEKMKVDLRQQREGDDEPDKKGGNELR
ncbi:MAG: hypothetical protein P1U61_07500 [Legionellaceae bacterium]|nr:hypothetical protein [Legionellaceae bacterium]